MKTAVTLCRVAEAAAGPFVFHDDLATGFAKAAEHGFDSVEGDQLSGKEDLGTSAVCIAPGETRKGTRLSADWNGERLLMREVKQLCNMTCM